MVASGLTPLQAISCATGRAAALLGLSDRGTLTPGKLADFVVLTANPVDDITNTEKIAARSFLIYHRFGSRLTPTASEKTGQYGEDKADCV